MADSAETISLWGLALCLFVSNAGFVWSVLHYTSIMG
jgi:hypothetical protein